MVDPSGVSTLDELSGLLRDLRRRQARRVCSSPLTFAELAARTGWPRTAIGAYFDGRALPPAERLDALVRLLGASPAERGAFASARERIETLEPLLPVAAAHPADRPGLPPATPGFAGRAGVIARLDRLLSDARAVVLAGPGGVGKTALAVHYGHRIADRFPGGAIFLDLRGSDPAGPPLPPAEALRMLLDALGVAPADLPLGMSARTGLFRTLTARRGVLLVLDDAADAAQVRPLLPAAGDSVALITGRAGPGRLSEVDGVATVTLEALDRTEARAVLAARVGAERTAAEPDAVDRIITACGRLPMALAVVSARVALHPELRLADVPDESVFAWSYDLLSPAAQHLFRGFGAHPGPYVSAAEADVLIGQSSVDALTELSRAQLVTEVRPGRYAMHPLLREHAAARTTAAERAAMQDRLVSQATEFAVLGLAMRRRRYRDAWRIADALDAHLDAAGRWDDRIAAQEIAIRAASRLGDAALLARAQRAQSAAYLRTGQHEAALRRLREAADCFLAQGDPAAAAHCRQDLAALLESMARFAEAIVHDELALALFRRAGDRHGQAAAHAAAAWHYAQAGRAAEAVAHGEAALALHADPHEVAAALAHLGRVHAALGERERSLDRLRAALEQYTELGDRLDEADTATRLGDALDGAPAIGLWRRAHAIYERLGHPAAATVAARLGI
ncbi:helix-turn-helix domain-containing protein [Dactylosporangium sp. CS-047395]|uniref:helix-turn-helix domain-containing protein n=1 Tax=Dactylosporangium sp. CS-047395 TaxID=3239936 RepID=UPI003D8D306C